jgi:hypothetical protein
MIFGYVRGDPTAFSVISPSYIASALRKSLTVLLESTSRRRASGPVIHHDGEECLFSHSLIIQMSLEAAHAAVLSNLPRASKRWSWAWDWSARVSTCTDLGPGRALYLQCSVWFEELKVSLLAWYLGFESFILDVIQLESPAWRHDDAAPSVSYYLVYQSLCTTPIYHH